MPFYLVNKQAQPNGDHEVHHTGCRLQPLPENAPRWRKRLAVGGRWARPALSVEAVDQAESTRTLKGRVRICERSQGSYGPDLTRARRPSVVHGH